MCDRYLVDKNRHATTALSYMAYSSVRLNIMQNNNALIVNDQQLIDLLTKNLSICIVIHYILAS